MKISSLNIEIIDICNLKCTMCDIWKNKTPHLLSTKDIDSICSSTYIDSTTNITLTGGEPFLHPNIQEIIETVHNHGLKVHTISTNGTFLKKLDDFLLFLQHKDIPFPNIHISLDGYEKVHDKQRGVLGSFRKTIATILGIKKKYGNISLKLKYTITSHNILDIQKVFILSNKLGIPISFKLVENDIHYTNNQNAPHLLSQPERNLVYKIINTLYKDQNTYLQNLLYYIKNNKINFACTTPQENIFIMANGNVFCCTHYDSIGNFFQENIDNIFFGEKHKNIITYLKRINCQKCFSAHGAYKSLI